MKFVRTVTVQKPLAEVFAYLSDFTTTQEWDPASVRTERISGDGGVGTEYHNVSRFMGREAELRYVVTQLDPDRRFALRGENKSLVAHDVMTLTGATENTTARTTENTTAKTIENTTAKTIEQTTDHTTDHTTVTYEATFELKGLGRIAAPLLAPALGRLVDRGAAGLEQALERL